MCLHEVCHVAGCPKTSTAHLLKSCNISGHYLHGECRFESCLYILYETGPQTALHIDTVGHPYASTNTSMQLYCVGVAVWYH